MLVEDAQMVMRFVDHYKEWRARWGKSALNNLLFGCIPQGDAWNPITWTLFRQAKDATVKL